MNAGSDAADDLSACCRRSDAPERLTTQGLLPASLRSGLLSMRILLAAPAQRVWEWLTEVDLLRRWSPVVPDRALVTPGPASARESGEADSVDAHVVEVTEPFRLVHRWGEDTLTWQLGPAGDQTVLQLVDSLADRDRYAEAAAGWHLCLGVLADRLAGGEAPRCVGADAPAGGWEGLRDAYRSAVVPNDADD